MLEKGICALETLTTFLSLTEEMLVVLRTDERGGQAGHEVFCFVLFFFYQGTGPEGGQALGGFSLPRSQLGMSASNLW